MAATALGIRWLLVMEAIERIEVAMRTAVELMSRGDVTSVYQGCTDDVRDLVATHVGAVSNPTCGSNSWPQSTRSIPLSVAVRAR